MSHRWISYSISLLVVSTSAAAHPFDVSKSEWTVDGNLVHGHVEVAARDLHGRALRDLVETKTQVHLGEACGAPVIEREWNEGDDGAAVDARFACPGAGDLSVKLPWLAEMPPEHRHVAHLTYGKTGLTAMLTKDNDGTSLSAPAPKPTPPPEPSRWPWIAAAGAVVLALVVMRIRARKR